MSDNSVLGLSVYQQLAIIGAVGIVMVVAGQTMSSAVDSSYNPTVTGIGLVVVLYVLARAGYEVVWGPTG